MFSYCCFEKQHESEDVVGCNYFKWCTEEDGDQRDSTILTQRRKIYNLEKDVKLLKKWVKILVGVVCFF